MHPSPCRSAPGSLLCRIFSAHTACQCDKLGETHTSSLSPSAPYPERLWWQNSHDWPEPSSCAWCWYQNQGHSIARTFFTWLPKQPCHFLSPHPDLEQFFFDCFSSNLGGIISRWLVTPLIWARQASFNFGVPYKASLPHTPNSICQLQALALMAPNHYTRCRCLGWAGCCPIWLFSSENWCRKAPVARLSLPVWLLVIKYSIYLRDQCRWCSTLVTYRRTFSKPRCGNWGLCSRAGSHFLPSNCF